MTSSPRDIWFMRRHKHWVHKAKQLSEISAEGKSFYRQTCRFLKFTRVVRPRWSGWMMSWTMFYIFHMFRVENKLISGTQILQTVDESANKLTFSSLFELLTSSQSPCCHEAVDVPTFHWNLMTTRIYNHAAPTCFLLDISRTSY